MMGLDVNHQRIKTNGIWMHIAEKGSGPVVLLLHGFPETWFTWHRQIDFLAAHGHHAVAPDLRGYGDTDSPLTPSSYSWFHIVGDLIGLLDHFAVQQAYVVGTDWGALAAWHLSLLRPDRVKGIVALTVPFFPRYPNLKPTESMKQMFGDDFYICQFQEAGRSERALARYDCATVLKKFLLINTTDMLIAPPGTEIIDCLETPSLLPPWITEEEIQIFADKFQESGFTGAFNYYRALDLNWELLAPWHGSKIEIPAKVIVGDKDMGFVSGGTKEYIESSTFKSLVPHHEDYPYPPPLHPTRGFVPWSMALPPTGSIISNPSPLRILKRDRETANLVLEDIVEDDVNPSISDTFQPPRENSMVPQDEHVVEIITATDVPPSSQCLSPVPSLNMTEFARGLQDNSNDDRDVVESAPPGQDYVHGYKVKTDLKGPQINDMLVELQLFKTHKLNVDWLLERLQQISETTSSSQEYLKLKEEAERCMESNTSIKREVERQRVHIDLIQKKISTLEKQMVENEAKAEKCTQKAANTLQNQSLVHGLL